MKVVSIAVAVLVISGTVKLVQPLWKTIPEEHVYAQQPPEEQLHQQRGYKLEYRAKAGQKWIEHISAEVSYTGQSVFGPNSADSEINAKILFRVKKCSKDTITITGVWEQLDFSLNGLEFEYQRSEEEDDDEDAADSAWEIYLQALVAGKLVIKSEPVNGRIKRLKLKPKRKILRRIHKQLGLRKPWSIPQCYVPPSGLLTSKEVKPGDSWSAKVQLYLPSNDGPNFFCITCNAKIRFLKIQKKDENTYAIIESNIDLSECEEDEIDGEAHVRYFINVEKGYVAKVKAEIEASMEGMEYEIIYEQKRQPIQFEVIK